MFCGKGMELASAGCADCCSDCASTAPACCTTATGCCDAACCEANCQLLPPDPISYEYHEPEENFVSIDDAKIKSLLLKIGQQQQQELQRQQQQRHQEQQQHQQIIGLLDDDEATVEPPLMIIGPARSLKPIMRSSPDIQLIPKQLEPQRIVARIELSDSEEEEVEEDASSEDEDARDLPLTAVSCELNDPSQIIVLQSDDDEQQSLTTKAVPKKRPTRPYIKRRGRHFYQCQACGKKVQSNYNLRRHMMIHTGERPFPCDLCERRFREFSDLKKHRRRHINDPRYICMICRLHPPMEQDSTRCVECEGKNLLLNPSEMEGNLSANAVENEKEEDKEAEQEQETDQDLEQEEEPMDDVIMSPPVATTIASSPPMLLVTLVPPLATPTQPPPNVVPAPPARPPMPRSCSSANSSSSLSNDAAPRVQARTSRNRRSYPCPLCHRPFGTRHNLKRHYMIHTGEKPFSCSKCRKPFRECSTLKKHMVTHVRDRWYKCLRCPAKYQDYLHYTEHKATHGSDPQLETGLNSHHRQRSSDSEDGDSSVDDWLECCECQRRFTQLDAYTAHLKQHDLELYGMSVDDIDDEDQEVDVA
ncbi:transcription factor E4F1 [Drosophila innubila]|uniref:transcription factor E4F1 n=1 Tax=Drosophila innubila TaxID=198719 RepID=UPI00148E40C4|nr:transcription factor E4F1 [Drosophila innubila]